MYPLISKLYLFEALKTLESDYFYFTVAVSQSLVIVHLSKQLIMLLNQPKIGSIDDDKIDNFTAFRIGCAIKVI